jgi:hypothetical protein
MMRTQTVEVVIASLCLWVMGAAVRADEPSTGTTPAANPVAMADYAAVPIGRITAGGSFGEDREVYQLDAMIPVLRSQTVGLFLNPRGVEVPDKGQEASLGLVARHLLEGPSVILGINGYYDAAKTEADNTFEQAGVGVEVLSRWVDVRANYYNPVTDPQMTETTMEEALKGWDAEVGVWLPYLSRTAPTAVYAGYYAFNPDGAGGDIDGFKARVESRVHPNITLDAEWYDDKDYAGTEYYVGVRLHIPLDFWKGARMHRGAGRVPLFSSRMLDPVHRDVRVRAFESKRAVKELIVPVRNEPVASAEPVVPARVPENCQTYATLDENGDVIYIQVCE